MHPRPRLRRRALTPSPQTPWRQVRQPLTGAAAAALLLAPSWAPAASPHPQSRPSAPPPAQPSVQTALWAGVWRGAIGVLPVQACLQHGDGADFGAYYYLKRLVIISLGPVVSGGRGAAPNREGEVWTEAPYSDRAAKGPLWRLTSVSRDRLQGVWSDGARTLPIDLARVPKIPGPPTGDDADPTADTPCGGLTFSRPRFTTPKVTMRPATLKGVAYTRLVMNPGGQFENSGMQTFRLNGTSPAVERVNKALSEGLPTGPGNATYFTCSMAALGQNGLDGDASSTRIPLIITPGWLIVQNSETDDCGGAHPNASVTYATYDLRRGVKVNPYDWFAKTALTQKIVDAGAPSPYAEVAFTRAFRKLIDDAYPRADGDCIGAEREADGFEVRLTPHGFAFTPQLPHVVMACAEDAEIPFAKAGAYLNEGGAAAIRSFRSEVAATR